MCLHDNASVLEIVFGTQYGQNIAVTFSSMEGVYSIFMLAYNQGIWYNYIK